jgi:acylphosphatase
MTLATQTRRYLVTGRVQGVGFRWFVEYEAQKLGVGGWVRNCQDGSVEVVACGTDKQLGELYDQLRKGPRAARVENVEVLDAPPLKDSKSFHIEGAW